MTYYPDLSPYVYGRRNSSADAGLLDGCPLLNIGWLSRFYRYPAAETSPDFRQQLLRFCAADYLVSVMRGLHFCEICELEARTTPVPGGTGEIRVAGAGVIFAAPELVYHYVAAHGYAPPAEFMSAILDGDPDAPVHRHLRALEG